jgi:hypothetical protein
MSVSSRFNEQVESKLYHLDICTHIRNDEDHDILTRRGFDVNLRLMKTSPVYRAVIAQCVHYIRDCATTKRAGYSRPMGFSGANAGIPFNIIAMRDGTYMINPQVIEASEKMRITSSDCGSLTLEKPINVRRPEYVTIEYYDLDGELHVVHGFLPTEQHEIDHNNGILITDPSRRV